MTHTGPSLAARPPAGRGGHALTGLLLGALLGVALQLQQARLWSMGVYAALVLLAPLLAWAAWRSRVRGALVLWLLAGALAAGGSTGWRAGVRQAERLDPALEGRDLRLTGRVSGLPQRGEAGWRFGFEVEQAAGLDGTPVRLPPRVQLGWYGSVATADETDAERPLAAELRAGDRWQLTARLKAPHGNLNPHGFDYELWLWEQGVGATGYVRGGPRDAPPRRLAEGGASIGRWRQAVRDRIVQGAASGDAEARRRAGIVAALVTGDQNAIERADWDVFRATGVAHLMSISGLHITMFAWLAAALVGAAWRRSARWGWPARANPCLWLPAPTAARIGGVLLAAGYALFSGWGVPAQRTVLMLATLTLLHVAGLRWPWWLNALLAAAVVLALDPWALMQPGFWLSFVAVAVLFATDSRAAGADRTGARARFVSLLREQGVVTLALTPLSLILFGQASVVGLLANLVAIPWVTLVVTPLALLGVPWAPLWALAGAALRPLAALLGTLAAWPWASVSLPAAPWWLGVAAVAGGLLLALRWPLPWRLAGLPLVLPLALWQPPRPAPGQFELLAADVGQGSAVLVRTARHTLLYDAGPRYSLESDAGHRVLVPLLRALGERVDTVVLSHRDSDHTGGARAVLAAQPRAAVRSSIEDGHELRALRPPTRCQAGQQWQWDGVLFELLHPEAADYARALKSNALSCVLRVRAAGGASALLAGDIEQAQEQALAARTPELRADLLLAPHHGSRGSSSSALLAAVRPRWVLVQAGYRNRFGHPAPEALARYAAVGAEPVASPRCGAMQWHSQRPGALHCQRDTAARYWHHRAP